MPSACSIARQLGVVATAVGERQTTTWFVGVSPPPPPSFGPFGANAGIALGGCTLSIVRVVSS